MAAPLVVPDASVLLQWVVPSADELDTNRALLLRTAIVRESVRALVPALWLYELGYSVARRFPTHAPEWLSAMVKFGLKEAPPSQRWLTTTLELTHRHGASLYDAACHATALVHGGMFVTAGARYIHQAGASGSIVPLSEWQPPRGASRRRS